MTIKYVSGAVSDAASGTVSAANQLEQLFVGLKRQAHQIMADDWAGQAAQAFDQAQAQWNRKAEGLNQAFGGMGAATQQASDNAFAADQKASGLFQA